MITLTDAQVVRIAETDYQWYLAEQSPPVLPCSRASLTAFMTVAYLSAMCILKHSTINIQIQIYSRREQKKREIRLPVVLLAVVCASQAGNGTPGPTAWTRGESDMTKVVPYFLKQIYLNKQRIVLKKNSPE